MPKAVQKEMKDDFWADAVEIKDRSEFLTLMKATVPHELILSYNNVKSYMNDTFTPTAQEYKQPVLDGIWDIPEELLDWKKKYLDRPFSKCLHTPQNTRHDQ